MARWLLVLLSALFPILLACPQATADVDNDDASNVQEGDNEDESDQDGEAGSGDAVVGQVVGVQSSGDASVDATNTTRDSSAESGDAEGSNTKVALVGNVGSGTTTVAADVANASADNVQEGDNSADVAQSAQAVSGDAVAGQVSGVVTAAGGTADVVLSNTTIGADVETGDGDIDNEAIVVVTGGLGSGGEGSGGLALVVSDASVLEGDTLEFTVSLVRGSGGGAGGAADTRTLEGNEEPPNQGVCFTYETSDGTAQAKADYAPSSGGGCIPPSSTSTTVSVGTFFDGDCPKGDENMELNLTSSQGASIADGTGIGTIRDFCK